MRFANPYQARTNHVDQTGVKALQRNIVMPLVMTSCLPSPESLLLSAPGLISLSSIPSTNNKGMKMTMSTGSTMTPRIHRKVIRTPSKHQGKLHPGKLHPGKRQPSKVTAGKLALMHQNQAQHAGKLINSRGKMLSRSPCHPRPIEVCDNSNDSGLGIDHPLEMHITHRNSGIRFSGQLDTPWKNENVQARIPKTDLKFDSDNANDNFNFPEITKISKQLTPIMTTYRAGLTGGKMPSSMASRRRVTMGQTQHPAIGPVNLCSQLAPISRDGRVQLQILSQPEQQHRARYQTEGSRGAVKDRSGNSFPIVKLIGYDKPATLQVFIGTDIGRVAPHMFYQACRVFGKNSTPCSEKKEDGTVLIEIDFDPQKNWQVICDCVGILKERNVDVEHRFGDQTGQRCKKKSTRCRMVFRTQIQNSNGAMETIQICSQQIVCTQPPGIPEICRKSLVSCPVNGGLELFLLGKNFLKDTKVVFQVESSNGHTQSIWEEQVLPDKEFLQQNHLVCGVPPYANLNINEPLSVRLFVVSGGKSSEPHKFLYTPANKNSIQHATLHHSAQGVNGYYVCGEMKEEVKPVLMWESVSSAGMMPPPTAPLRRPSIILPDPHSPLLNDFKTEMDDSSQGSGIDNDNSDMIAVHMRKKRYKHQNENSMDENSMDTTHVHQCSESITHDSSLNIIHRSDSMAVNDDAVNMLQLNKTNNDVCRMNDGNMDLLMRHNDNSKLSLVEENSVNSYSQPSNMTSQLIGTALERQPQSLNNSCEILNTPRLMSQEELKVMDLRMKPGSMGSENDTPSLATIRQFVDTHNKLPTQTGQSVETYLSNIDNKSMLPQPVDKSASINAFSQQLQNTTDKVMQCVAAAIFQSSGESANGANMYPSQPSMQEMIIPQVTPIEQLIASKQILQDISMANNIMSGTLNNAQVKSEMYNSNCTQVDLNRDNVSSNSQLVHHQSMMNNSNVQMEALVSSAFHASIMGNGSTGTSNLDTMMNPASDSRLSSTHADSSPTRNSPTSHDIILSAHASPEMTLNSNNSPVNQDLMHTHNTGVLSPEIILNPQVSPTMMCPQDGALLGTQPLGASISQQLMPNTHNLNQNSQDGLTIMTNQPNQSDNIALITSPHMLSPTVKTPPAAVKNMILNAAAEIFTSDKAIDVLVTTAINTANILTNENVQNQPSLICTQAPSGPVVELQQQSDQQNMNGAASQYPPPYSSQIPPDQYSSQAIVDSAVGNLVSHMKDDNGNEPSAMSQAVTQVVSQVFSQAVSQAVNQEIKTSNSVPIQELSSMTDNELLSYINPSCFDQVMG